MYCEDLTVSALEHEIGQSTKLETIARDSRC